MSVLLEKALQKEYSVKHDGHVSLPVCFIGSRVQVNDKWYLVKSDKYKGYILVGKTLAGTKIKIMAVQDDYTK
jgi:hypothetical protein